MDSSTCRTGRLVWLSLACPYTRSLDQKRGVCIHPDMDLTSVHRAPTLVVYRRNRPRKIIAKSRKCEGVLLAKSRILNRTNPIRPVD